MAIYLSFSIYLFSYLIYLSLHLSIDLSVGRFLYQLIYFIIYLTIFFHRSLSSTCPMSSLPARGSSGGRPDFYLGGNPFLCDCNLEWLKSINTHHDDPNVGGSGGLGFSLSGGGGRNSVAGGGGRYPFVRDLESIYCKLIYSADNVYIPLVEATPADFLCSYSAHCFALCHCCDFDACDCEMTCPENCTCYHDQVGQPLSSQVFGLM